MAKIVPQAEQPAYLPPGIAPPTTVAMQLNPAAPGTVMYYPPGTAGVPQGAVVMPMIPQPPKYVYTPNDFLTLSVITAILCGIFSPLTLFMSIPAVIISLKSQESAKTGNINSARNQGMCAAYLSVAAIITALVVAIVVTGMTIGIIYHIVSNIGAPKK